MKTEKRVGDVIEVGELLLFTSGAYSDFGVNGLYRAKQPFVMPGKQREYSKAGELVPDHARVSADPELVEELSYVEVWAND